MYAYMHARMSLLERPHASALALSMPCVAVVVVDTCCCPEASNAFCNFTTTTTTNPDAGPPPHTAPWTMLATAPHM